MVSSHGQKWHCMSCPLVVAANHAQVELSEDRNTTSSYEFNRLNKCFSISSKLTLAVA